MRVFRRVLPMGIDPATLSGRIADWDASIFASLTFNGSNISAWADQSATGKNLSQGTASKQPLYSATGLNGHPALLLTRANIQYLSAASSLWTGDPAFTVFAACNLSDAAFAALLSLGGVGVLGSITFLANYNAATKGGLATNGGNAQWTGAAGNMNGMILSWTKSASSQIGTGNMYRNGAAATFVAASASTLAVTAGTTVVGVNVASINTTYAVGGAIARVVAFDHVLTAAEHQGVVNNLANKHLS